MRDVLLLFFAFIFLCATDKSVESEVKSSMELLVLDASTEEPITTAKINIDQKTHEAYTDFDGIVKFTDVIVGMHNTEVSLVTYQKQQLNAFQVSKDNNKLIVKLQP